MPHLHKWEHQCNYTGCKSQVSMKAVYIGHSKGMVHDGKQWEWCKTEKLDHYGGVVYGLFPVCPRQKTDTNSQELVTIWVTCYEQETSFHVVESIPEWLCWSDWWTVHIKKWTSLVRQWLENTSDITAGVISWLCELDADVCYRLWWSSFLLGQVLQ